MICYEKGTAPPRLTALAATPNMAWDGLGAGDRRPIRAALVRDQAGLCAYCQRRIRADDDPSTARSRMKIEHWIARSESSEHQFIWSNLLGVCLGISENGSRGNSQHCDASRSNRKLFLHPVAGQGPDPRDHLRYTKNGRVEPADSDTRVAADIATLNLNAWQLVRAREVVLDAAWERLKRSGFAIGELRRLEQSLRVIPGTQLQEHAEFLRHHVCKKIRGQK
jgi:uncharacterized protein (TIGR02646 family)